MTFLNIDIDYREKLKIMLTKTEKMLKRMKIREKISYIKHSQQEAYF